MNQLLAARDLIRLFVASGAQFESDSRTAFRSLARRDITVPIGIDKISAISRYEASSTSQSKMTSRKAMGSCSIATRIVSERERSTSMDSALVEFTGKSGTTSSESSGTVEPRFASEHEVRKVFFKI